MHLELYVDDLHEAHRRLGALGATTPEHQPEPETGLIVVLDPADRPSVLPLRAPLALSDAALSGAVRTVRLPDQERAP